MSTDSVLDCAFGAGLTSLSGGLDRLVKWFDFSAYDEGYIVGQHDEVCLLTDREQNSPKRKEQERTEKRQKKTGQNITEQRITKRLESRLERQVHREE